MSELAKISEQHRRRRAVVYVRQSTLAQVAHNLESAARQYALQERAVALGWPAEAVVVVDEDTGRSGASSEGRLGFKELVAAVGLGEVGLILALEVSRLARCSADWHQLLELCALTGTLVAVSDGLYSPGDFNDRLLLGLKGTMSEAELHLIRSRLQGGLRNKAGRGELRMHLPVGLERDDDGGIVLSPDEQVRAAIAHVFLLWGRLGSARQIVAELIAEGQRLPRRRIGERRVRWARATYGAVHDFLTNPAYAGAFVYGRTREEKRVGPDGRVRARSVEVPLERWAVCLPDHHPGYVSWEDYLTTRERLKQNARPRGEGGGAAREGAALLQGLLRCGRCGRRMQVAYSGRDGRSPRYACVRGRDLHGTDSACQTLGGRRLDRAVADAFLDAVRPAGLRACAEAARPAAARARTGRVRWRTREAPIRRLRARAPAGRAYARAHLRARARRPRTRAARTRRARTNAAGSAQRAGAQGARPARPRPTAPLGGARDRRSRPQGAAAHADRRGRRHRARPRGARRGRDRLGGRRPLAAPAAAQPARPRTPPHQRGDDRSRPPTRRAPPRPADRRDPQQTGPAQRHRPALQRAAREEPAPASRHPRRAATRPRQRRRLDRRGRRRAFRLNSDDPPLAERRSAPRRTGDVARPLADPPHRRGATQLRARRARRLPAAQRGREAARRRPPDRVAPGPTRPAARDPGHARTPKRASDRGIRSGGWTVCATAKLRRAV